MRTPPDEVVVAIAVDPHHRGIATYGWAVSVDMAERYVRCILAHVLPGGTCERRGPMNWLWRSGSDGPEDMRAFDCALHDVAGVRVSDPECTARFIDVRMGIVHRSVVQATPWDVDDLVRVADVALHEAIAGGGAVVVAQPGTVEHFIARGEMAAEVAAAADADMFPLFQPIVSLSGASLSAAAPHGRGLHVTGYEALLRWRRNGEPVGPDVFLNLLELSELIVPVGRSVIGRSLDVLAGPVTEMLGPAAFMSVNLSAAQLRDRWLVDFLRESLADRGLGPARLWVEISENAVVAEGSVAAEVICDLHEVGCKICVDDLGAGVGALGYVRDLPIDVLKVDRALVGRMPTERTDRAVVRAICDLASASGVITVAEGVETEQMFSMVEELGFDMAQGYLFGRPGELG
ncbi:EAL domain-containing protein (putative c-di-GMP-specific phosphodiesterase class I) [Gordonia amarae]|uniref:EAL domain-containing protein n=1 Tax=Gordonia amarae TaxID=36821 RepID=UPI0002D9BA7B|nr:EAL domain-containing protein [Gordonia amarae]MCS3877568.1 EAL domain-containing protein (putative c-di-GMP-specific phosphodiesterase class I) [Gordonia amarae]